MKELNFNQMSVLRAGSWRCALKTVVFLAEAGVGIAACVETGGLACGVGIGLIASSYYDWLEACHPEMVEGPFLPS